MTDRDLCRRLFMLGTEASVEAARRIEWLALDHPRNIGGTDVDALSTALELSKRGPGR